MPSEGEMIEQRIEYVQPVYTSKILPLRDAFAFRSDRPFQWLQSVCIWILRKMKCYAMTETCSISYQSFSTHKFAEMIYKQHGDFLHYSHSTDGEILIGAMDFQEMMALEISSPLHFEFPYHVAENGKPHLMGMPVTVIPWMKGILVIPSRKP